MSYQAHEYSGKESGIMIYASTEELHALGKQLQNCESEVGDFGNVATCKVEGNPEYKISFHIQNTPDLPRPNVPNKSTLTFWLYALMVPLSIIGLLSLLN